MVHYSKKTSCYTHTHSHTHHTLLPTASMCQSDECLLPLSDLQGQHQWGKCSQAASFPWQLRQGNSSGIIHHRLATALIANVIKLAGVLQALQHWGWTRAGWGWVKWGFASLFLKLEHAVYMHMHTCLMQHSYVNLLKDFITPYHDTKHCNYITVKWTICLGDHNSVGCLHTRAYENIYTHMQLVLRAKDRVNRKMWNLSIQN